MPKREIDRTKVEGLIARNRELVEQIDKLRAEKRYLLEQLALASCPYEIGTVLQCDRSRSWDKQQKLVTVRLAGIDWNRWGDIEYYGIRIRKDGSDGARVRISFGKYGDNWQEVTDAEEGG